MTSVPTFRGTVANGRLRLDDRSSFAHRLTTLEGRRIEVSVQPERTKRSLDQNAFLHVLAEQIAEDTGETLLQTKRLATLEALGAEEGIERYSILGREFIEVRGTSSLTTTECSRVVEVLLKQAEFLGIRVPA